MHHEARGKECDFILQANVGSFYVLMLLVMCMFPANFLGDYSTSVEVSQISGQLNLRFASSPFAASQLLSLWYEPQQNGTGMRWLLCTVEMSKFSNMHVSSLSCLCLWAQLFIHLHKCLLCGLHWPVQKHILFSLSCSGIPLQIIQDVSPSQLEQLPGL